MRLIRLSHLPVLLAIVTACSPRESGGTVRDVRYQTRDGYTIAASVYPAAGQKPSGLILVHMLGATRDSWAPFAAKARSMGYSVIAMDLRGHGDSTEQSGRHTSHKSFTKPDWTAAADDLAGAKACLLEAGADPDNLVIIGAGIGGNLALRYAATDADIQAAVLVSPGLDYRGVTAEDAIERYGNRPLLMMTALGDAYAASSCRALEKAAKGHCEIREYDGSAHGTDLLDAFPVCADQILDWVRTILGGNPAPVPG